MPFDQFRKRVASVLRVGKLPERRLFLAHSSPNVASVAFLRSTSGLEQEKKNGFIIALLLLPDTLPPM